MVALVLVGATQPAYAEGATEVVLVKRGGVTAYEEASEEFSESCRVHLRVVSFGDEGVTVESARLKPSQLVVTVGQEALDALAKGGLQIIPTLAFHTAGLIGPPAVPPADLLLRILLTARPGTREVVTVYGPRSEATFQAAHRAAERIGISLRGERVSSGPEAVRKLHALVEGPAHAIWLPGDTDVVTPQVFRYALQLQLERGLPLLAATRQQVHAGALLAVDFSPRSAGRAAAELANRILEGQPATERREVELHGGARISVNAQVARRLGINPEPLRRLGASVE